MSRSTSPATYRSRKLFGQVTDAQLRPGDGLDRLRHGVREVVDRLVQGQRPASPVAGDDAVGAGPHGQAGGRVVVDDGRAADVPVGLDAVERRTP